MFSPLTLSLFSILLTFLTTILIFLLPLPVLSTQNIPQHHQKLHAPHPLRHALLPSNPLIRRQNECSSPSNTPCADGTGCCPSGVPCLLSPNNIPICGAECDRPLVLCNIPPSSMNPSPTAAPGSLPTSMGEFITGNQLLCCNQGSSCDLQNLGICTPTAVGSFQSVATFTGDLGSVGYETTGTMTGSGMGGEMGGGEASMTSGEMAAATTSSGGVGRGFDGLDGAGKAVFGIVGVLLAI